MNAPTVTIVTVPSSPVETPLLAIASRSVAHLQHNASRPIHSLPAELFLDILFQSIKFFDRLIPQLHTLAQVCSYWAHSILSNSRFWCVIAQEERLFVPTIVKKNLHGPLIVRCAGRADAEGFRDFIQIASEQIHRWEFLTSQSSPLDRDILRLLDAPTPLLQSLVVHHRYGRPSGLHFPLSTAAHALVHVEVSGVSLDWVCPSLSGLKYLEIAHLYLRSPSLTQIVAILIASPQLEWLTLRKIGGVTLSTEDRATSQIRNIIKMPCLIGVVIWSLGTGYTQDYLASIIDAPRCRIFHTNVRFNSLRRSQSTFNRLAKSTMCADSFQVTVSYYGSQIEVDIVSPASVRSEGFVGWGKATTNPQQHIKINVSYDLEKWEHLVRELDWPLKGSQLTIELWHGPQGDDDNAPIPFSGDHFAFWESVTKLTVHQGYTNTIPLLQFLAEPTIGDGPARWPCPRLSELNFAMFDDTNTGAWAEALAEFLRKRAAVEKGAEKDPEWQMPVPMKCIFGPQLMVERIQGLGVPEVRYFRNDLEFLSETQVINSW